MHPEFEAQLARTRGWVEAHALLGRALDDVERAAAESAITVRVIGDRDDQSRLVTADYSATRVNVKTADAMVTGVDGVY